MIVFEIPDRAHSHDGCYMISSIIEKVVPHSEFGFAEQAGVVIPIGLATPGKGCPGFNPHIKRMRFCSFIDLMKRVKTRDPVVIFNKVS